MVKVPQLKMWNNPDFVNQRVPYFSSSCSSSSFLFSVVTFCCCVKTPFHRVMLHCITEWKNEKGRSKVQAWSLHSLKKTGEMLSWRPSFAHILPTSTGISTGRSAMPL